MTRKQLQELVEKAKTTMPYDLKSIERDAILFKWRSLDPEFKIPWQPEILLSTEGALGYDKVKKYTLQYHKNIYLSYYIM